MSLTTVTYVDGCNASYSQFKPHLWRLHDVRGDWGDFAALHPTCTAREVHFLSASLLSPAGTRTQGWERLSQKEKKRKKKTHQKDVCLALGKKPQRQRVKSIKLIVAVVLYHPFETLCRYGVRWKLFSSVNRCVEGGCGQHQGASGGNLLIYTMRLPALASVSAPVKCLIHPDPPVSWGLGVSGVQWTWRKSFGLREIYDVQTVLL